MYIINKFLLTFFFAIGAFANEALIKESLRKLEQSSSYIANGVTAGFQLAPNYLIVDLVKKDCSKRERSGYCPAEDVGRIEVKTDASKEALEGILELEKIEYSPYILDFAEKRNNLNKYKSKIKPGNTANIGWIGIQEKFRGANLSYPLICAALEILQKAYNKEYVFLDDSSDKPSYYTKLGFVDIGENFRLGKYMFGSIAEILKNQNCMNYGPSHF